MNKLKQVIDSNMTLHVDDDTGSMGVTYTASLPFWIEMRHMKPVSLDADDHIRRHLRKAMTHHLMELAYGEMRSEFYSLYRKIARSATAREAHDLIVKLDEFAEKYING